MLAAKAAISIWGIMFRLLILCMFYVLAPIAAIAGDRVALLVGNSDYELDQLDLPNPANDATALGIALRELGFQVIEAIDRDQAQVDAALAEFAIAAKGAEMAVFFFAGHGVQVSGENYLISTDFKEFDANGLQNSATTMGEIRAVFEEAKPDVGIVILDACRNNPFVTAGQAPPGLARSSGGAGLLIAYATDPGNVAYDGTGDNSVFTKAIIDNIGTKGLEARIMFGRVRQQVILETRGQQIPWVEEAVLGEHYFAGRQGVVNVGNAYSRELALWRTISAQTEIAAFENYIAEFPDGVFTAFAQDRIRMIQQARAAGAPSGLSSAELLEGESPDRIESALAVLGFLQSTRDLSDVTLERLANAFDLYRVQLPNPDEASTERLYQDAARMTIFLGATTAQQLRTDIIALSSIDRTLTIARDAIAQIEIIAETNSAALPILEDARRDIIAIEASLDQVLGRLDESRLYYQSLIDTAQNHFPEAFAEEEAESTLPPTGLSRLEQRLADDAALFIEHVQSYTPETEGTYAWLIDFLPQD